MCGIAGIVGSTDPNNLLSLRKMNEVMHLRGPDEIGEWHRGLAFLGHRRLSIIDIENGQQPMFKIIKGKYQVLVFNGEIYNYERIKTQLLREGIVFHTNSDTEVLLQLLITKGISHTLEVIEGMFAFAFWDEKKQCLYLARDRVGIKPLYYHVNSSSCITFCSMLEGVINTGIERTVNLEALEYLLTIGYPPSPLTMYSGVNELAPGSLLKWEAGKISIEKYWQINWSDKFIGSEDEALEELDLLLDVVLKDHLVSDVPVGTFLSGGIDSSAVTARAKRHYGPKLTSYTVSFPNQSYDESKDAKLVARHLGVHHSIIPMESFVLDEGLCRFILQNVGQPFLDSSCIPFYFVSKAASDKVKVVLSGDGGDELFAGYDTFYYGNKINQLSNIPKFFRFGVLKILNGIKTPRSWGDKVRSVKKALKYSFYSQEELLLHLKTTFDPEELSWLTRIFEDKEPRLSFLRRYLNETHEENFITNLSRFLMEVDLPGDMLRKVDTMSMAASIEVRVPLLDRRIVEFAQKLPSSMKIKDGVRKAIFKNVVRPELPPQIFRKSKQGFAIPLHNTFSAQFFEYCRDSLLTDGNEIHNIFEKRKIEYIISLCESKENLIPHMWSLYTGYHALWIILQLAVWAKEKGIALTPDL